MSDALARPAAAGASAAPRPNAVVAVLALAGIVVSLMQTLVIPIVPELPTLLHASASNAAWAVTATLLAAAVATPVVGRLGDMIGKRRMLLVSILRSATFASTAVAPLRRTAADPRVRRTAALSSRLKDRLPSAHASRTDCPRLTPQGPTALGSRL
ncbi:MFS transporter [Streptomyces sp. NPDC002766]|uniref:MFS transporter n=1 Tax=Streptomyces sp. NPDC002766 TaxID=3154429 RepID=UPI0033218238